jgi:hypothetical protein
MMAFSGVRNSWISCRSESGRKVGAEQAVAGSSPAAGATSSKRGRRAVPR